MSYIFNWNDRDYLQQKVKESKTIAEVLFRLGFKSDASGNRDTFQRYVSLYEIDISHLNKLNNRTCRKDGDNKYISSETYLKNGVKIASYKLKQKLIKEGIKEDKCENCGLIEWNNLPIFKSLHHINGDSCDNRLENLILLCPNCHAQTPNFGSKNSSHYHTAKQYKKSTCVCCGKIFEVKQKSKIKYCSNECKTKNRQNIGEERFCIACGRSFNGRAGKIYCSPKCRCIQGRSTRKKGKEILAKTNVSSVKIKKEKTVKRPPKEMLEEDMRILKSKVQIGKKYGVSDNAVKKWLIYYKLPFMFKDIKTFLEQ